MVSVKSEIVHLFTYLLHMMEVELHDLVGRSRQNLEMLAVWQLIELITGRSGLLVLCIFGSI